MITIPSYDNLNITFDAFSDSRGTLTVANLRGESILPFGVQRVFWINHVPQGGERGKHAHQTCWEALVAVNGSFTVRLDNGCEKPRCVTLQSPHTALIIPPMMWCELYDFNENAVCLCLASGDYDKDGYISDYNEYLRCIKALSKHNE